MKYLVTLLVVGVSASYGQQFNGTVFDLETGRIQVINGSFSRTGDWKTDALIEINENYRRARAEREIAEQTRLLREIANER